MGRPQNRAHVALVLAMVFAGSSVVSGKFMVESFPIFIASFLRVSLAMIVLIAMVLFSERSLGRHSARTHLVLFLQAFTGITMFNGFMLAGLERTTASTSGIITSLTPVMVLMLSLLFGERLNRRSLAGVAIATLGLVALNWTGENGEATSTEILGGVFVLVAVIGEGFYTVFGKMVNERVSPLAQAMWIAIYGTMTFIPLALWELPDFSMADTRMSGWIAIVYAGIAVTVFSSWLWFLGLRWVPASRAGIFTGVLPVSAVVLSALLLSESIGWPHFVGIASVFCAITLITIKPTRQPIVATVPATK